MSTTVFEGKNIQGTILKLGIPAIIGQLATLIYNLVDTYFVSLTNSPAQIAAVTLSTPVLLIIMSISNVFGMSGSSVVARLLGEKNTKTAKSSVTFYFYAMTAAGIIVLIAGLLFIEPIARLAGEDAENIGYDRSCKDCKYRKSHIFCRVRSQYSHEKYKYRHEYHRPHIIAEFVRNNRKAAIPIFEDFKHLSSFPAGCVLSQQLVLSYPVFRPL